MTQEEMFLQPGTNLFPSLSSCSLEPLSLHVAKLHLFVITNDTISLRKCSSYHNYFKICLEGMSFEGQ